MIEAFAPICTLQQIDQAVLVDYNDQCCMELSASHETYSEKCRKITANRITHQSTPLLARYHSSH